MQSGSAAPKVFISYSHDSQGHKERILTLADRLRAEGIDCNLDQYKMSPSEGWPRWMMNQLDWANFVLVICTEQYHRRFRGHEEPDRGRGVSWEGAIITQELYDAQVKNTKFIPIVFSWEDQSYIPVILGGASFYNLGIEHNYEALYRHITNQPQSPKPPLGMLQQLPCRERQQFFLDETHHKNLQQELLAASQGLLNWKSTLGNNQQIERPELEQLLNRIEVDDSSTTIVLGSPGSGKSALLATLGHRVMDRGYALLAIKADYLSNTVNTLEDLRCDDQLHLSMNPRDAIKAVANRERVILLVDQLDAVSELLDRQPGRLNVLLTLIQSLAGTKGVHIVATCREFEFRHATQFARLEGFEQLNPCPLTWEQISPLLEAAGHTPASMGEPLRELLQNPLHLKIFLEVARPGEVFDSSQKLLDRLWETRILNQPEASKYVAFLEQLAQHMTQQEVLWLPTSVADNCSEICQFLEQRGILTVNQDNLTIGFSHQTYYDHTLARAFARGSESLVDLVLERQDGLFVRPILLRSLNYLRGTAPMQYQRELRTLLRSAEASNCLLKNKIAKLALNNLNHLSGKIRLWALSILRSLQLIYVHSHIYTLLIEFIGAQQKPEPVEVELLIPLLNSKTEGPRVLDAMTGSSGWFTHLRDRLEFRRWLEKPPEQAAYCVPLLLVAANFAADEVWNLLEDYWLDNSAYDFLSIRLMMNMRQWNPQRLGLAQQVIRRSNIDWYDVSAIAERVLENLPELAPKLLRAHLERLLDYAIEESNKPQPALPPDTNETERAFHAYKYDSRNPLKNLLETESGFYAIEEFAKACPKAFLEAIWGWFTGLVSRIADDVYSAVTSYRTDRLLDFKFHRGEIIQSLLTAISELADRDKQAFLSFVARNVDSEFLIVHRLLAHGLQQIAVQEPQRVLEYLLGDPRRLSLGDKLGGDRHRDTEQLVTAVCPYLQSGDKLRLEQAIRAWNYWIPEGDEQADFRFRCLQYNRQHRLSLLQAFPEGCLSPDAKRLKEQEERAFPWTRDQAENCHSTIAQFVGPRMTKEEMSHASDQHLLNLFDELSDATQWENPRRKWFEDSSRAGGVIQQSREFGELVKDDPERFLRILPQLEPQRHESYVGDALADLAGTDFPASKLIRLVESLDQRGFVSENFRSEAARALEKVAERNQGLPQSILALLESWLSTHSQPELSHYRDEAEHRSHELKSPILFGVGGSHILPGGRRSIVRAIAAGYLKQDPSDLKNWARLIESRLGVEQHPVVWVDILTDMPPLLNGDRVQATELFDVVIRNCPEVLYYRWALYFIAHTIGWFEPKETVQGWLEMLLTDGSSFCHQAYGELLLIHYLQYQDKWSVERIRHHLTNQDNEAILCGLAHAASHQWVQRRCRAIAAEILYSLANSPCVAVQDAVANVFGCSREGFELDPGMRKLIQAVCNNKSILLKAASDLIEIIEVEDLVEREPQVVSEVCQSLLSQIGSELTNPSRPLVFLAESLTTVAIKLHRQSTYREVGLCIFEQLLALNLREARSALEILDRKPHRLNYVAPRRRLRRQHTLRG